MSWMLVLILLLGLVTVCVIINLNSSEDEEYVSDKGLREAFLKEYINSDRCVFVKFESLPKSFKIGNVYFDKCVEGGCYYQEFLSYVVVDGKIYDNGSLSIDQDWGFYFRTTNRDLTNYILDNLDKVVEIKQ